MIFLRHQSNPNNVENFARFVLHGFVFIFSCFFNSLAFGGSDDDVPEKYRTEPLVEDGVKEKVSRFPILKDLDWSKVYVRELYFEGPAVDEFSVDVWAKKPVAIGGRSFSRGTRVSGKHFIFRLWGFEPVNINGVKICDQLGQHAQTLEIFEIKLCEDLKLPEGVIPAGSVVDFRKGLPKEAINLRDIGCVRIGGATTLNGHKLIKGEEVHPNSVDDFKTPDKSCFRGPG